jgi:hypothetical protein
VKYLHNNGRTSDRGFIYVASRDRLYYELALLSAQSLRDYFPEAHLTLFTHERFVDERAAKMFDNVIVDIPVHYRAKMWCMARTPYQKTIYNDADSIIKHRDIKKMHDFLDECDMFFGTCLLYTVGNPKWGYMDHAQTEQPKYHGSLCGYNKSDLTLDFMQTWFDKYLEQLNNPWPYGKNHPKEWQIFDMFTLWRMTSGKFEEFDRFKALNIKLLERRYNTTGQDLPEDIGGKPVIVQVDKGTWKKIPHAWAIIEKGIEDEAHSLEKPPLKGPIKQYN